MKPRPIVARFAGEIALKATAARSRFRKRLIGNVKDALARGGVRFDLRRESARLVVTTDAPHAPDVLCRVFGLGSVSPVDAVCPADVAAIVAAGSVAYGQLVSGRRFAVRARTGRAGPSGRAVERELGAALARTGRVDLGDPDITVGVEIAGEQARLFVERRPGAGGLPLGTSGRAVALVSGGLDSTVAAWRAMRRGLSLDFAFANLAGREHERAALAVLKVLCDGWAHGDRPTVHVLPAAPLAEAIRARVRRDMAQVVFKRVLYGAAAELAAAAGAEAIVTGESLGQVSSQTLPNLRALEAGCALPVLRPLIGADKSEIVTRCRALGLHDLAARVPETCRLVDGRPAVAAAAADVDTELAALGAQPTRALLDDRHEIDLATLRLADVTGTPTSIARIPAGALVLDLRAPTAGGTLAGARRYDAADLLRDSSNLPLDRPLVVVCAVGARSAAVVDALRRRGHDAYALAGGGAALRPTDRGTDGRSR